MRLCRARFSSFFFLCFRIFLRRFLITLPTTKGSSAAWEAQWILGPGWEVNLEPDGRARREGAGEGARRGLAQAERAKGGVVRHQ